MVFRYSRKSQCSLKTSKNIENRLKNRHKINPKSTKERPKITKKHPKGSQERPKSSKRHPRAPKDASRTPKARKIPPTRPPGRPKRGRLSKNPNPRPALPEPPFPPDPPTQETLTHGMQLQDAQSALSVIRRTAVGAQACQNNMLLYYGCFKCCYN